MDIQSVKKCINEYSILLPLVSQREAYKVFILGHTFSLMYWLHEATHPEYSIDSDNWLPFEESCKAGYAISCHPSWLLNKTRTDSLQLYSIYEKYLLAEPLAFTTAYTKQIKAVVAVLLLTTKTPPIELLNLAKLLYPFEHVYAQRFIVDNCPSIPLYVPTTTTESIIQVLRPILKQCKQPGKLSGLCDSLHADDADAVLCAALGQHLGRIFPYSKSDGGEKFKPGAVVTKCGAAALLVNEHVALSIHSLIIGEDKVPRTSIRISGESEACLDYTFPQDYFIRTSNIPFFRNEVPTLCLAGQCNIAPDFSSYSIMTGPVQQSQFGSKKIDILLSWLVSTLLQEQDNLKAVGFGMACDKENCTATKYTTDDSLSYHYLLGLIQRNHLAPYYSESIFSIMYNVPTSALHVDTASLSFIDPHSEPTNLLEKLMIGASLYISWKEPFTEFFRHSIREINAQISAKFLEASKVMPHKLLKEAYNFKIIQEAGANPIAFIKKQIEDHKITEKYDLMRGDDVYNHPDVKHYCGPLKISKHNEVLKGLSHITQCITAIVYVKMIGLASCIHHHNNETVSTIPDHPSFTCYLPKFKTNEFDIFEIPEVSLAGNENDKISDEF